MNEPNLKQWKRRALKAEAELEMVRKALAENVTIRQEGFHENAALRVALKEIQEASNWAYGAISGRNGGLASFDVSEIEVVA